MSVSKRRSQQASDLGARLASASRGRLGSNQSAIKRMTVDSILSGSSDIPSGQPRTMPGQRPGPVAGRRPSSSGLPTATSRTGRPMPSRTTKISEKLVLLPVSEISPEEDEELEAHLGRRLADEESRLLRDEEQDTLRKRGGIRGKSYAERLPKTQRTEKVARVTAYCTAQAYKMKEMAEFLRKRHEAKTKLYDDCLYTIYALPLLPGTDGYRLRSKPILKTPGTGRTVLDLEIEQNEQRDYHEGYFEEDPDRPNDRHVTRDGSRDGDGAPHFGDAESMSPINRLAPDAKNFAEMFVFSYGVVVFWNFTEHQERDVLADLTFASTDSGISLLTKPLDQEDYETEEFHFEYSADVERPRVFNDMITLLPRADHMVKLTISHAIAQSTKLCLFEERMSKTMLDAQHVPKTLGTTGELDMRRSEIVRIIGRLFKSRADINLSSNILDVPNFFWESEPNLHPLYSAIRDYLEISERIKVLNDRCRVFLDLGAMLMDSIADSKMSYITWVIIVLIVISIVVTVTEVVMRFGLIEKSKLPRPGQVGGGGVPNATLYGGAGPVVLGSKSGVVELTVGQVGEEDGVRAELRRVLEGASVEELTRWKAFLEGGEGLSVGEL